MFYENVIPPIKLEKDLISEVDLEIRYTHSFPNEALFGMVMPLLQKITNNDLSKVQNLQPIPIPEEVVKLNPELLFQLRYKIEINNFSFAIGNNSILFTVSKPYCGWQNWKSFFDPILLDVVQLGIIEHITRIGLRYIDITEGDLLPSTNLKIQIKSDTLTNGKSPISFYTNFKAGEYYTNLRLDNNGVYQNKNATSIDVDCYITEQELENISINDSLNHIEKLHNLNKKIFFGLFSNEFIKSLNPLY